MASQVTNREKQLLLLQSTEFFSNFDNDDLDDLLKKCSVRKYSTSTFIIKEKSEGHSFFVILRGGVSIVKGSLNEGRRKLASLMTGECFGEMALLLKEPRTAGVVTDEETFIFEINGEQVSGLKLATREKLYQQFAVTLATRLKDMSEKKPEEFISWAR